MSQNILNEETVPLTTNSINEQQHIADEIFKYQQQETNMAANFATEQKRIENEKLHSQNSIPSTSYIQQPNSIPVSAQVLQHPSLCATIPYQNGMVPNYSTSMYANGSALPVGSQPHLNNLHFNYSKVNSKDRPLSYPTLPMTTIQNNNIHMQNQVTAPNTLPRIKQASPQPVKKDPEKQNEKPKAPASGGKAQQSKITFLDGTPLENREVAVLKNIVGKWKALCNKRKDTGDSSSQFRKGPAPVGEGGKGKRKFVIRCSHGTLDSDVDSIASDDENAAHLKETFASNKGLILYFAKLAISPDESEGIDVRFVQSLLNGGADINYSDKYGQTVLHEVARAWHVDNAKFLISNGAKVNKGDKFGRTPLHLCAAVGYTEMIEFLVQNGAKVHARTKGEEQTPIHYAARNNSVPSLKMLVKLGASIMDRDYKNRTPLYIATENGRVEAARYLLELGAPAAVCDDEGNSCLSIMVDKMPGIALEALEQYYTIDRALRKKYYYLNYLEKNLTPEEEEKCYLRSLPKKERKKKKAHLKNQRKKRDEKNTAKAKAKGIHAKTALEVIVEFNKLELIMHPAIQTLVEVKWNLFGKKACIYNVAKNLFYAILWSTLGVSVPADGNYYLPLSQKWWRLVLEIVGVGMTVYFMVTQYTEARKVIKGQAAFKNWHYNSVERDKEFCHPKWPEEEKYLEQELERIQTSKSGRYFSSSWNCIDWLIHFIVWLIVITRIASVVWQNETLRVTHLRIFAMSLVLIWLRLLKVCRAFQSLGPFITLLGHVVQDTLKFAFLFFEFFIPYVCAFWMLFGGEENAKKMRERGYDGEGYRKMNDLVYSVYQMTLMGEFYWSDLLCIDKIMAQILVGTYIAISTVICLNLFIALMSDTFARVYQNARANAMLQQADQILSAEKVLNKKKRIMVRSYISESCAPLERYMAEEEGKNKNNPGDRVYDKINRHTDMVIESLKESLKDLSKELKSLKKDVDSAKRQTPPTIRNWQSGTDKKIVEMQDSLIGIESKQNEMLRLLELTMNRPFSSSEI